MLLTLFGFCLLRLDSCPKRLEKTTTAKEELRQHERDERDEKDEKDEKDVESGGNQKTRTVFISRTIPCWILSAAPASCDLFQVCVCGEGEGGWWGVGGAAGGLQTNC